MHRGIHGEGSVTVERIKKDMTTSIGAKRPLGFSQQVVHSFVDLTSDNEEERPAKRQRSGTISPPVDKRPKEAPNVQILSKRLLENNVDSTHVTNSVKGSPRKFSGQLSPPRYTPSNARSWLRYQHPFLDTNRSSGKRVTNGHSTTLAQPQRPKALTSGVANLSIRPPSPAQKPKLLEVDVAKGKSRSPTVIDLGSDSEDVAVTTASKRVLPPTKAARSESPVWQEEPPDLSKWTEPRPIRFDSHIITQTQSGPGGTSNDVPVLKPAISMSSAFKATLTVTTPPTSQQNTPLIQVKVPPTPAQAVAKERAVLTRLKQDKKCEYVKNNPQEVGEVIYIAPFDDSSPEINRRARQKRLKAKIDRSAIPLDFGTTSSTNSQALSSTSSGIVHPRKAAHRILNERFKLSVSPALSLKHQHGTRQLSGKFQFVSDYVLSKKVRSRKPVLLPPRQCGCPDRRCEDGCRCAVVQEKLGSKFVDIAGLQPYSRSQNGLVVLSDAFLAADKDEHKVKIVYECNDYCGCDQRCTNRVVQNGRTIPLQIFDTDNRGFGVKPMKDIARGQFIDLYLGEVLTVGEVERREDAVEENAMSYFMSLDVFTTDENSTLLVDGANFGSVMRFVNHSCEPNAKTVPVVLSKDTKHLYHVAFFAIKDIPKGTEITIDYDPDLQNLEEEPLDSLVVQCRCGSANCRKRLWAPGKAKRARKRRGLLVKDDD